jgi:hypothetical protein
MPLPNGEIFNNVDFWVKLTIAVLSCYIAKTVGRFERNIRENKTNSEELTRKFTEHMGWHKGKGDNL